MSEATPVIEAEEVKTVPPVEKSPAADLRDIQQLLVMGIFPGQMAPSVVKAYQLLEMMAKQVEDDSKKPS